MDINKTKLEGVLTIVPPTVFNDHRGTYTELYNKKLYRSSGIKINFVQDDISTSTKDVLRGIHGDRKTWKLISCLYGKFYLVIVNWDKKSSQFGQWDSFIMTANGIQILVPPKHGNAHLILSDTAIFHYKQSTYYDRKSQFTLKWNDPKLNISWPIDNPVLSERDANA